MEKKITLLIAIVCIGSFLNTNTRPHWPREWHTEKYKRDHGIDERPKYLAPGEVFGPREKVRREIESSRDKEERLEQEEQNRRQRQRDERHEEKRARHERKNLKENRRELEERL